MEDNHFAVSIVYKGIGDIAVSVGDGNGAATEIEVVGLESTAGCLTNETSAVDIPGNCTVTQYMICLVYFNITHSHRICKHTQKQPHPRARLPNYIVILRNI